MDAESNHNAPRNAQGVDHQQLSSSPPVVHPAGGGGTWAGPVPGGGGGSITARYKTMSPASLPIARSPCLTIPPGLSPTTLLESPVLLSNIPLAEPSPTTGTFSFRPCMNAGVISALVTDAFSWNVSKKHCLGDGSSAGNFVFKPHEEPGSSPGVLDAVNPNSEKNQNFEQSQEYPEPQAFVKIETMAVSAKDLTLSVAASEPPACGVTSNSTTLANLSPEESRIRKGLDAEAQRVSLDQKGAPLTVVERPSEDGYNWRKYGQKLVKGSEFPRSYYKCTHPNCQMKKKLERNHDGLVTAIIYEGVHDHPKPQPSRRLAVGASDNAHVDDRLDRSTNIEEKSMNTLGQACNQLESNGTPELSSVSVSDDDEDGEGSGVHRDKLDDEADEDDPESKRRKLEAVAMDSAITTRTTREPRVVVQTLSEVDILDDGYRWRKYGQKVVKGNPNPRSYYKCTNAGCQVRKHVERASHDPKSVITTYEGKHNHDVPTSSSTSRECSAPMTIQGLNPLNASIQMALNPVMLMPPNHIDGSRAVPYSGGPDAVSLDLGVGISQTAENNSIQRQSEAEAENMLRQVHGSDVSNSGMNCPGQSAGILPFYGNGIMSNRADHYRVKEEEGQPFNFNVMPSLDNFHRGSGRFILGPKVDAAHARQFTG